jgi:hypothetical protein
MVAYNFRSQFVHPIRNGTKIHTIRKIGKRPHAAVGDSLQLYTGMRTKKCRKIVKDQVCFAAFEIEIDVGAKQFRSIKIDGRRIAKCQ